MKAKITNTKFIKERPNKYGGSLYSHLIEYDGKKAYYQSKSKDQKKFVKGQECEFTEEERTGKDGGIYLVVKPVQAGQSNYGRQVKREQSRYSGFAMAYSKDLVVAGKIDIIDMSQYASLMFNWMVEMDKTLES